MQQDRKGKSFLFAIVSVLLLMWLFTVVGATWKRVVLLYIMTFIPLQCLLSYYGVHPRCPVFSPAYARNFLAGAMSTLIAGGYYLLTDGSLFWRVISLILIAGALYQGAKAGVITASTTRVIRSLMMSYERGAVPDGKLIYVVIGGAGGFGTRFLRDFGMKLFWSFWQFTNVADVLQASRHFSKVFADAQRRAEYFGRRPAGSVKTMGRAFAFAFGLLPAFWRTFLASRVAIGYLVWSDLEMYPKEFREYVAEFASAFIGVPSMSGQAVRHILKRTPSWADVSQVDAKTVLEGISTDSRIGKVLLGMFRKRIDKTIPRIASEEHDLLRRMHYCRGPSILVLPELIDAPFHEATDVLNGYSVVSNWKRETRVLVSVVRQSIVSSCLPMMSSDADLPEVSRRIARELAEKGLAPVADCYLRFRMASSDVERFLCLLDCFEVLIKQSVIVLVLNKFAGEDSKELDGLIHQLKRPSLGLWRNILQSLVKDSLGERDSHALVEAIRLFWQKPVDPPARDLIDAVNGSGLTWKGDLPRNYLGWLEWLTWLRNVTRGHGAVDDRVVSPIWHRFHALFLQVVAQMRPLVLESSLAMRNDAGRMDVLSGWLRGPARSSRLSWTLPQNVPDVYVFPVLRSSSEDLPLQPFICVKGNHCYTWNSQRESIIDYLDYSDGKIENIPLGQLTRT